jgi:hypothetical protein
MIIYFTDQFGGNAAIQAHWRNTAVYYGTGGYHGSFANGNALQNDGARSNPYFIFYYDRPGICAAALSFFIHKIMANGLEAYTRAYLAIAADADCIKAFKPHLCI